MKQITTILCLCTLLFFTSLVSQAQTTDTDNTAKVIFYRSSEDGGKAYALTSNNQELAKLKKGEKFEQVLAPGTYYYMADPSTKHVLKLELRAGQTYYIRVGRDDDFFDGQPSLQMSTVQEYQQDRAKGD